MSKSTPNKYVSFVLDACAKVAGINECEQHTFCTYFLKPGSVVVDLGGNKGNFSCYIADNFACQVYAVEPTPDLFANFPHREGVKVFQYAISDKNEPVTFYLSDVDVASSTNKDLAHSFGLMNSVTVSGITLAKFLQNNQISQIDLLKVDIEGAEFDLFQSLSDEFLKDCIKQITVEFHDFIENMYDSQKVVEVRRRLEALGYMTINASARYANNSDVLFVNLVEEIKPSVRFGLNTMKNVCRFLAERQKRIRNREEGKELTLL